MEKIVFLLLLASRSVKSSPLPEMDDWNYEENPSLWKDGHPACGGAHQSPIDISTCDVIGANVSRLTFINYDKIFPETVTNNGFTVMIKLQPNAAGDDMPYIMNGGLPGVYKFVQLHFHWGSDDSRGSEHRIDGRKYPAELHMVHYNTKYASFSDATNYPDGLAVLSILIDIEKNDNVAFRHIENFDQILHTNGSVTAVLSNPIEIQDLLPDDTNNFFRYTGSLTTPPCTEAVIWTVFQDSIALSEREMKKFRHLFNKDGQILEDNDRPVQPLNNRIVYYRFEVADDQ